MMTQIGEALGLALASSGRLATKCAYVASTVTDDPTDDDEDLEDDDVALDEPNKSSKLRDNLALSGRAGWGTQGSWNEQTPPDASGKKPIAIRPRDTSTTPAAAQVSVSPHDDTSSSTKADYDWQVAAHHLIPGNASLKPSSLYQHFMRKGGTLTAAGSKFKLRTNIGYNVNGNHNGMWLPGSYAIRSGKVPTGQSSPLGTTWSAIDRPWRLAYIKAVFARSKAQFHDYHTDYNENVLAALDAMSQVVINHVKVCEECKANAGDECDPPWHLKSRLYQLSIRLRKQLRTDPATAKWRWYTSDEYYALRSDKIVPR